MIQIKYKYTKKERKGLICIRDCVQMDKIRLEKTGKQQKKMHQKLPKTLQEKIKGIANINDIKRKNLKPQRI